ncbi:MAG: PD40 domain-containing protein [Mucilaginibacter polytrichastri]|nr:PD40 domain-containing protein [Mucilaginibacter polytrichastri]
MNKLYLERTIKTGVKTALILVFLFASFQHASAQYFGQNKVRYKRLDFKVYKTPHFELYYYLKNDSLMKRFAKESELWYTIHQQVFRDTFRTANPLILYNNHPDFQQTTAISGDIGVGTGGVTEGLKNRVVMPLMEHHQQTRHVLGHELVHAFQYHTLFSGDSTQLENIGNIPLWMVEGMAEYLSLGKKDAYTAMWMRDAYLNKDIPTLKDLTTSSKYFPYRYGEAFWSFLGSTYGDTIIVPLFRNTAKFGYEMAIRRTFGFDDRTLSNLWKNSIEAAYKPLLKDTAQVPVGRAIITDKNAGKQNVAPAISPDGKFVAFLSEKDLFSIDLFLADAQSGRIIRKLTSKVSNTHIDEFNFIESAGAWSPDSKQFAFSVFGSGRNKLVIVNAMNGAQRLNEGMGEVEEFSNLTWSPNGEDIAFTGLKEGQSDIYSYNIRTKKLTQITNDMYSDYQPSYSRDGSKIVYSSDRTTYDKSFEQHIPFNLAIVDVRTKKITDIHAFNGANNLNPVFSSDDKQVYFLSNRDGFRNMYRFTIENGQIEQMTDLFTGICGITEFSPALSISNNNDVLYSYYRSQKYTIYNAKASQFKPVAVQPDATNFEAALLPPTRAVGVDLINSNLDNFLAYQQIPNDSIKTIAYRPQFKLDYLASSGVGASVGRFGTGLASGVQGIFSDILGQNQMFVGAAVNGEIYDFGGQFAYINQKGRWNLGAGVSHIPYQFATFGYTQRTLPAGNGEQIPVLSEDYFIIRNFEDAANLFTAYPFSRITRFEVGVGATHYSYRVDRFSTYYAQDSLGRVTGYVGSERKRVSTEEAEQNFGSSLNPFTVFTTNVALVGDNSFFGVASPLNGFRYRIGADGFIGDYRLVATTLDLRKYVRLKPVTIAGRFYNYMRLGPDANRLYPVYIGYPYFIRGYEANSFYNNNNGTSSPGSFTIDQLQGSRFAVANFEVRLPFTGPEKLSVVKSKLLFTELNAFFDIGVAWSKGQKVYFQSKPPLLEDAPILDQNGNDTGQRQPVYGRVPATSIGLSLRVNVFGYFVLEPYVAIPFQRNDVNTGVFGLTFAPGW